MKLSFRLSDLYLIQKDKLATALLYIGMLILFLSSLLPWFLWPIATIYPAIACMFIASSWLLARNCGAPLFTRTNYLLPLFAFLLFTIYERLSTNSNINGYIMLVFRAIDYAALFCLNTEKIQSVITFICKVLATLLGFSLIAHLSYVAGFPMPGGSNIDFGEFYSFTNYYLFILDDRNMFYLFPRFNSYFLEPGHIAAAAAFLLFAQRGQWRKWYNIVLLATIFFSFSLGGYVYLTVIVFLNLWVARKHIARKLILVLGIFTVAIVMTFTYNGGNNLVHDLIMLRLEIDDGEMAGDNRVTGSFDADYENYIQTSDVILGREYKAIEFGNAGYKVFFYDHGIVGIMLILAFYFISMMYTPNKRAFVAALFVATLYFIVTAFMLWENIFLPLYAAAYLQTTNRHLAIQK